MLCFMPCAGRGDRLNAKGFGPKELHEVAGRPMIDYSLDAVEKRGVTDVVLAVTYGKESVAKYVALSRPKLYLATVYQREPLGTGHAVGLLDPLLQHYSARVLYLMPDSVHVGLPIMLGTEAYPVVYVWPTDVPDRMGVFEWDSKGFATAHVEKKQPEFKPQGGTYWAWGAAVLTKDFVEMCTKVCAKGPAVDGQEFTIDDAFDIWMSRSMIRVVPCDGYYVDCGTLEGIAEAERMLR